MPYFIVPDGVLERYRHDPLIVAIYTGIARCALARRGPVPLSAPDIAQWLGIAGEPGRVAVMRRIQRLTTDGWMVTTTRPGSKAMLTPTWGRARDGEVRPWDWAKRGRGQPDWQRGRRVPLTLFDDYLGRLIPDPTRPAEQRRWWNRSLLDGIDVGTWILGLRGAGASTLQLRHLGMTGDTLLTLDELRGRVRSGTLTIVDDQGDIVFVTAGSHPTEETQRTRSRNSRSPDHTSGSDQPIDHTADPAGQTAAICATVAHGRSQPLIAWDHEVINNMIPPTDLDHETRGSEDDRSVGVYIPEILQQETTDNRKLRQTSLPEGIFNHNDQRVAEGHLALNPGMVIPTGEWLELADLERQHGVARMLIWQARARRRTQAASGRVIPSYYRACAKREAADLYQPPRAQPQRRTTAPPIAAESCAAQETPSACPEPTVAMRMPGQCAAATPVRPAISPEADELLRAMGLHARSALAEVPLELIRQWLPLVEHPALLARFPRDHRGWIWTQLRDQIAPPHAEELVAWERATSAHAPPDWRAIAKTSDGLMRMGDDLEGLLEVPAPEASPMDGSPRPVAPLLDNLAAQFRDEVRLRSRDRALQQAVDRADIALCGDTLLLRCPGADLRLLLAHRALLRSAAAGAGYRGALQCIAIQG